SALYPLSLHDALPISRSAPANRNPNARLLPLEDQLRRVARGRRELERERLDGRAERLRVHGAHAHIRRPHVLVDRNTPALNAARSEEHTSELQSRSDL